MKKLKTLFSPRKIAVWIAIILVILCVPEVNSSSMSQTEAIVTIMGIEKTEDDKLEVAVSVLTPSQDVGGNFQVYTGVADTLSEAVEIIAISIGKDVGFAQCKIVAMGEELCKTGIMKTIDFMTRTKKLRHNTVLVSFTGKAQDFVEAVVDLNAKKSLKLNQIIDFDKRYLLSEHSDIESFYSGYFDELSVGVIPKIEMIEQQVDNAIEVSAGQGQSNAGGQSSSQDSKPKYILNTGSMMALKYGKKYLDISSEDVKRMNIFLNTQQDAQIKLSGLKKEPFNGNDVVVNLSKQSIDIKTKFDGDKPVFSVNVEVAVTVQEVLDNSPSKIMLKNNREYLTKELNDKVKETLNLQMRQMADYCVNNNIDLIGVYKYFNAYRYKSFKKYIDKVGKDNFLQGIEFEFNTHVNSKF